MVGGEGGRFIIAVPINSPTCRVFLSLRDGWGADSISVGCDDS